MRWWGLITVAGCSFDPEPAPAVAIDTAVAPDAFVCAGRYSITFSGNPSRYFIEPTRQLDWRAAEADCELDRGHLFAPDTDAEVAGLQPMTGGGDKLFVGLVQPLAQPTPIAGWRLVTGMPATMQWQGGKPDDGGQEDGEQQAGALGDNGLDDEDHTSDRRFICECDGVAADPAVAALLP